MDYTTILFIAAAPLIVATQVALLVRKMSEPEKMMRPVPNGISPDKQKILLDYKNWLAERDLEYLTSFQFGVIQAAVFKQRNAQRFFNFNFHQKVTFDVESRFDEVSSIETATSGSTGMFPPCPGTYRQSFPNVSADDAWRRHLEGETYLIKKFGLEWKPLTKPYEQVLLNSMRAHMQYVRSIPFYAFRALYWFAVTRRVMANKSVQQQFP
jgi:hypothetical protein